MALHDTLNLRREEVVPVSLLLFQSVFLGFFLGAFDVGANTLFLNNFGQAMIPRAIVISGMTGIILTSLYSYFQNRVSFATLAVMNLGTVFILTFMLRAGYYFSDSRWLAFALFVLMGPLNIIALVGFWGTVGRIFDLRQGKRIFGFIDTGQVVGVIISSLSVPFLIAAGIATKDLLYISATSIFLAVLIQFVISSRYPEKLKVKVVKTVSQSSFIDTLRIPYVRSMAMFVTFSMLVAFFVHYLFLSVADERFDSVDEMAKFFGGLMGSLTIVSVLIKTFVYGPLMKTYGLKISLIVSPVIMLLITAGAAIVGSVFGYSLASGTFTFFFLLISLSKFFQKALKDSIEGPVLKLIYQSLNPGIRHEVQARVDGTINEIAALSSGVLLSVLGLIGFFNLINYTHVLLGIILLWLYFAVKLYNGYKRTLKETLDKASRAEKTEPSQLHQFESLTGTNIKRKYRLIEFSRPWLLIESLKQDLEGFGAQEMISICNKIKELGDIKLIKNLEWKHAQTESFDLKQTIEETIEYLSGIEAGSNDERLINTLISSKDFNDRILAAKYIGASTNETLKKSLTLLLRDLVPAVKKQAILASRGSQSKEVISFLIEFLDKDFYAPMAHEALVSSGDNGLEMLMIAFNRSNATEVFRKRIIRIIPETGSSSAPDTLFGLLLVTSGFKHLVLKGLVNLKYSIRENKTMALHQIIIDQAGVCAWNLNIIYHCPSEDEAPGLKDELENNFSESLNDLFQMLKLQYDSSSIDAVIENLELGTGESISFAIELLDTFMFEDLKLYVFPLLEETSLNNKVWALQSYFPLRSYTSEEMLKSIINRNENLITKQSKIYALNAFRKIKNLSVSADLAAQLFNNDRIMRQLTAEIVSGISEDEFINYKKRLGDKLRVELNRIYEMHHEVNKDTLERHTFYRDNSRKDKSSAPLFWLYNASVMKVNNINIFELGRFKTGKHVLLIESGSLTLYDGKDKIRTYSNGDILITETIDNHNSSVQAAENTIIHFIDYNKFTAELYDNENLTEYLI